MTSTAKHTPGPCRHQGRNGVITTMPQFLDSLLGAVAVGLVVYSLVRIVLAV